jgi:selenide,water dikinase
MLKASDAGAELDLAAVPLYAGALVLARAGIASTLLPENLWLAGVLRTDTDEAARAILFDPQTSGGLLAGVPAANAPTCVAQLLASGYNHASIVGRVADSPDANSIRITGTLS